MNILLLTPQLPYPPRQGTTIRNFNLLRELAANHTIDLLTFTAPDEVLNQESPLHMLCRSVRAVEQPTRGLVRRGFETLFRSLPDMGLRLESNEMRKLTETYSKENHYDVIQTEGIEMAQYGELAVNVSQGDGRRHPIWVFDNHNCEYLLQKRNALTDLKKPRRWVAATYSVIQWQKLERYEARICRTADAVVAVSQADAQALYRLAPGLDVTVVSNGIDLDAYAYVGDDDTVIEPALVFTGKMDYRPNIDAVLWFAHHVLPLIQEIQPEVKFQIVGMNPHQRLDELRDNPSIEITGLVPETISYIQQAGVYVIPLRVGGGTRFKALEAMACGKTVVTTSLGIEGIPVRHGHELLIADTPPAFAEAVLHLLADDSQARIERQQMGRMARAFVEEQYGWQQIVPKLEAIYQPTVFS